MLFICKYSDYFFFFFFLILYLDTLPLVRFSLAARAFSEGLSSDHVAGVFEDILLVGRKVLSLP